MKIFKIEIRKPFDINIPHEGVKKGDIGIYGKVIVDAIKEEEILEIKTPEGTTWANPKKIKKDRRIIYRHYLKPEPMLLYLLTPKYGNKEDFEPKEIPEYTEEGLRKLHDAYKLVFKK